MEFKKPDVFSTNWHMDIIKRKSFRGKICSNKPFVATIKVSSRMARAVLTDYFNQHGSASVVYKIQLLGWFECWFPRYQIEG